MRVVNQSDLGGLDGVGLASSDRGSQSRRVEARGRNGTSIAGRRVGCAWQCWAVNGFGSSSYRVRMSERAKDECLRV